MGFNVQKFTCGAGSALLYGRQDDYNEVKAIRFSTDAFGWLVRNSHWAADTIEAGPLRSDQPSPAPLGQELVWNERLKRWE